MKNHSILFNLIPFAYAHHKIVCNVKGEPIDYVFVDVNDKFEKLTGLSRTDIINKTVTECIPEIIYDTFNWIEFYGDIALGKTGSKEFEQYSKSLDRWFKVHVVSHESNYFTTYFTDVSAEHIIASASKQLQDYNSDTINYQEIVDAVCKISGANNA